MATTKLLDLTALLPLADSPLADTTLFARSPLAFLRLAMQYSPDLAYVSLSDKGPASVIPIHPVLVKQVLTDTRVYPKPAQSAIGAYLFGDGLITSQCDHWKRQRKLLQPVFHREALAGAEAAVVETTGEMLAGWKPGQVIDVADEMTRLTLRILGRVLFGVDFTLESRAIGQAISALLSQVHQPAEHTPAELAAALATLDEVVFQVIEARRASAKQGDLLSLLLACQRDDPAFMTDQLVRDEVMNFLIAGHETTAVALSWVWYFFARYPEVEQTLRAQLEERLGGRPPALADLARVPYARMVVEESLRLRPPVWATSRQVAVDTELGGYFLPAGTPVLVSPYLTHRHPKFWRAPEQFYPPRHCPGRTPHHRFSLIPFGGGPRQCIGSDFALFEAQLILAMVARRYRLHTLPDYQAEPEPLMSLRIKGGLPVMVEAVRVGWNNDQQVCQKGSH